MPTTWARMRWGTPSWIRRNGLPLGVAILGILASLLVWRELVDSRRNQELRTVSALASQGRYGIEVRLGRQLQALEDLARHWARFGGKPYAQWREGADLLIESQPGLRFVAWVDPDWGRLRVAAGPTPRAADLAPPDATTLLDQVRAHRGEQAIVGPLYDTEGRRIYRVFVPVNFAGDNRGVLAATVNLEGFLSAAFADSSPGYAVTVRWSGEEVFRRGEPAEGYSWWSAEGPVRSRLGSVWQVSHRPTESLVATAFDPLPAYLLAGGIALSLMLGALIHQARVAHGAVRFLHAANRGLDERVRVAAEQGVALHALNLELEERVAARTAELGEVITDLEAFNYSVSHDLRSPLGAVVNFAALLEEDYGGRLDQAGLDMLERIRRSAESGLDLLDGLLRLSRAARNAPKRRPVDMAELAREAFEEASGAQGNPAVQLRVDEIPPALCDPVMIGNVFANLLSNSIKYSRGQDPIHVHVGGAVEDGENLYFVRDTGVGFDMRYSKKLFGVFERLHASEEFEGTGVGLAMVAKIVRRHGGRVWAESEIGRGATFYFSLPRAGNAPR